MQEDALNEIVRRHMKPMVPIATGWQSVSWLPRDIRAVLFDVYGTLFISECGPDECGDKAVRVKALIEAMDILDIDLRGSKAATAHDLLKSTIRGLHTAAKRRGVRWPEVDIVEVWQIVLESLSAEGHIPRRALNDGVVRQLALEYECRVNPVWPMPGCRRCLRELHATGFTLGIISNAQFYTPMLFSTLLGHPPEELGFARDLQFYSYQWRQAKAGCLLHEHAAGVLAARGITPEQTVCVGNDLESDVLPAKRLGMRTVLFAGDQRSFRPCLDEGWLHAHAPDAVITSLAELTELLLRWRRTNGRAAEQSQEPPP